MTTAISLSGGRGKAAMQAYTQRGIIWKVRGEDEKAWEDFKQAERLGSRFAHKQVWGKGGRKERELVGGWRKERGRGIL